MKTIYESLNFVVENDKYVNGFYEYSEDIPSLPQRLNRSLKVIEPKALFILNEKPIILFFDKSVDVQKIFKQCWNFSEAPIIIIENESDFDIYNGFDYILENDDFSLPKISKDNKLNYISLISGKYFGNAQKEFDNKDRVDKNLLKNIQEARKKLLKINLEEHINIANALLGRMIFIRYLIDRNVKFNFNKIFNSQKIDLKREELKRVLLSKKETYELFEYLKSEDGFNGDWFPIEEEEDNLVDEKHLSILHRLIDGVDLETGQRTLFEIYDFSIIPIEFISNVYESFIGEQNQKESGSYYTPTFLVDYILKYTVDNYFENNHQEYNCKVLDPACGSGIFLVETLRKLISQYEKVTGDSISSEKIKELVKDNIYGIDKDKKAVQISVFSLYLTMLDYQDPSDIKEFKFPYLLNSENNPDTPNFFENDFFDTDAEYNDFLKKEKLDFIIGNPPYGRGIAKNDKLVKSYIENNQISVGNEDIVQPFMIRVKDLSSKNTKISFIVTSKVLYNLGAKKFRENHFFNEFKVSHILELSSIRKEIFDKAKVPVAILFYKHSTLQEVRENTINYISIKPNSLFSKLKVFFIAKSDCKKVLQSKLLDNDYLWKILVYGSYLDFNFIKRLQSGQYKTIQDLVDNKKLIKYQGFKRTDNSVKEEKRINTQKLHEFDFIDTGAKKKDLKPFYISNNLENFSYDSVAYINRKLADDFTDLYKPPVLLFTGGLNKELKQNSAISYTNAVFTSSVVALKPVDTDTDILKIINGLFYSKFFSYYLLQTASSTGVRQEECDDYEKLALPYVEERKIIGIVSKIEELKKDYYNNNDILKSNTYDSELKVLTTKLDNLILKVFNLTPKENALIDYATNIIIPWVIPTKIDKKVFSQLQPKDKKIEAYINIFIEHYSKIYKEINKYFGVEVLWDEYAIGIYFKVLDKEPTSQIVWKKEPNIQNFLKLSSGKTLDNLFIQKDIKGFESDGFYVVKPNEYKNWHEAIGYLDFYEFKDAILRAGKQQCLN